jgi:hypothetical protein
MKEMINPNVLLMENTLKSSFDVVVTLVNRYKEERELHFKKKRKDFLRENYAGTRHVVLVDIYPPTPMEEGVYYIKRNGKTVWIRMSEAEFDDLST